MLTLNIPESGDAPLFEAILEPTVTAVDKLVKNKDMGEGEINTFRGRKNKIAVGVPYYENLISRLVEENKEIPHEIKQMMANNDFHFVALSCSFLPDRDCKFVWASFGVDLRTRSKYGEPYEEKPTVYDMAPSEVLSEIKYSRKVNFSPEGKLSLGVVNMGMRVIDIETEKEFIIHEPQIFAYGIGRSKVAWHFRTTKEKGIWGNKGGLLLIVKAQKNSKIKGRFLLGAEVGFNIGKWIPIPLSKREDKVVDDEYDLSE